MMALTATATGRVREDIVSQLRLRDPACYVASFNRPNLSYEVWQKSKPYDQIIPFLFELTLDKRELSIARHAKPPICSPPG